MFFERSEEDRGTGGENWAQLTEEGSGTRRQRRKYY